MKIRVFWVVVITLGIAVAGVATLSKRASVTSLRGFEEPLVAIGGNKAADHDPALIAAIQIYKQRKLYEDVSAITNYLDANPQSPWKFSLLANLGISYRKTGYYSKAVDAWEQAWKLGKSDKEPQVQNLSNQVAADLTTLLSSLGRSERLGPLLTETKGRHFFGASGALLTTANEDLWLMKHKPGDSFKCGPYALESIQTQLDKRKVHSKILMEAKSTPKGFSLTQVRDLSNQLNMNYQIAKREVGSEIILPSVVHWKSGHYAAILKKQGNFYLTKDPTFAQQTLVTADALEDESDGYFLVPKGVLPSGWSAVSDGEGDTVWGRGNPPHVTPGATKKDDKKTTPDCSNPGMAGYNILLMLDSLSISDSPVGYTPPVGPDLHFTITYNQLEASQPSNLYFSNFGPCWNYSWLSYVSLPTSTGGTATVNPTGGGQETYDASTFTTIGSGSYIGYYGNEPQSQATLWVTSAGTYERHLPDGTVEVFGLVDTGIRAFLTSIVDPRGNILTINYMTDGSYRITSITDALSQTTTLSYGLAPGTLDLSNPLTYLVTQITDPYGRSATFGYDTSSTPELTSITDVLGITSGFTYSGGSAISQMTTPYGNTSFSSSYGSINSYGTPQIRSLTVTEPDGSEVCAESRLDGSNYPTSLDNYPSCEPFPTDFGIGAYNASYISYRNTYYWDKKAMQVTGNNPESDYTQSHIYHFLHSTDGTSESPILESEKAALERRVWYAYPGQTYYPDGVYTAQPALFEGTSGFPCAVIRMVGGPDLVNAWGGYSGGTEQVWQYQYNNSANPAAVTTVIDPLGRQTNFTYDSTSGIDLLQVTQNSVSGADTLESIVYDNSLNPPHCPVSITDAAGQTTSYTYNSEGQITSVTPPLRSGHSAETTSYSYTGNYLTSIAEPMTGATTTFTYDAIGGHTVNRVKTRADSESYTVTYSYDNLDRVAQIAYPDSTAETLSYLNPSTGAVDMDLHSTTDRLGRTTTRTYDSTRHMTSITDPKGQTSHYGWCSCGNLISITDPNGNITYLNRDVESRLTSVVYPGGTQPPAAPDYTYDNFGRTSTYSDKRGDMATYSYNQDNTLSGVSYSLAAGTAAPPSESYGYDSYYRRITSCGGISFTYVPAGTLGAEQPQTVNNSLTGGSAEVAYSYDERGRVVGRSADGSGSQTTVLDSLGRVTNITNPLGSFDYSYFDPTHPTGRIGNISYPNGQSTVYNYFGNTGDERLQEIKNLSPSGAVLSQDDYTYDALGKIQTTQEKIDSNTPLLWTYGYDSADQLTSAGLTNTAITSPAVRSDAYGYDSAGNATTFNTSGVSRTPTFNAVNQLTGSTPSGNRVTGFTGALNGAATVTVNGISATVNGGHYFSGTTSLTPGSTGTVSVAATDSNGNSRTNHYQLSVPAEPTYSPSYDADGNELTDGAGRTFTWDAKNELASIAYSAGASTLFTYDAFGRCMAIVEKNSGGAVTSTKQLVWDGSAIIEERNASDSVAKRFFGQGEQIGSVSYYYTRDYLGSIREMTDTTGSIQVRYAYDPYGRVNIVQGTQASDFQYAGYYEHALSGLNLTRYREYDPATAKWLSRDPIGERGGLNLYRYVNNNPISQLDPSGLCQCCVEEADAVRKAADRLKTAVASKGVLQGFTGSPLPSLDPKDMAKDKLTEKATGAAVGEELSGMVGSAAGVPGIVGSAIFTPDVEDAANKMLAALNQYILCKQLFSQLTICQFDQADSYIQEAKEEFEAAEKMFDAQYE